MAVAVIRVNDRVGSSGAPSSLKTAEIAYNHFDDAFYIGKGDDGSGNATTIHEIAGASFAKLASPALTGTPTAPTAATGTDTTQIASTEFVQQEIEAALVGLDFQADVLDVQVDATLDPGAAPTTGDRYIITASAALHANFGTITGVGDGDIVEYNGSAFEVSYDASSDGEGALVWDRDSNTWQSYSGSAWAEFGGLAGVTAGAGLTKTGDTIDVVSADSGRIVVNTDNIDLATTGVSANTYQGITVDAYGRVTAASDQGYVDGTTGTTDNALLRADGTGASTAQGSPVTLADDGTLDGVIIDGGDY